MPCSLSKGHEGAPSRPLERAGVRASAVKPTPRYFTAVALPLTLSQRERGQHGPAPIIALYHHSTSPVLNAMTKFVFVTGGVVSSLGKGIAAASLAAILESRGLKVTLVKLDPYINVDPGTMSPFQHGEVFVTADGTEADLDLGHYERFVRMTAGR